MAWTNPRHLVTHSHTHAHTHTHVLTHTRILTHLTHTPSHTHSSSLTHTLTHSLTHPPPGNTPLYVASFEGFSEAVELLVTAKASVHAKGDHDVTALLVAVQNGHLKCTECLLNAKADPCVVGGTKPMSLAIFHGFADIVTCLLAHCDIKRMYPQLKSANGVTPNTHPPTHPHTYPPIFILPLTLNLTLILIPTHPHPHSHPHPLILTLSLAKPPKTSNPPQTSRLPSSENFRFWEFCATRWRPSTWGWTCTLSC